MSFQIYLLTILALFAAGLGFCILGVTARYRRHPDLARGFFVVAGVQFVYATGFAIINMP